MTEQYAQPNINNPRGARSFVAASPPVNVQLNFDDELVVADTTADSIGFILPLASQFPGWEIIVKATNAASSGNPVFVGADPASAETIDGAPFVTLTADQQALFVKSDGSNWRIISDSAGGGAVSGISLDLTYDPNAAADEPPVLFTTWAGILAAAASIPGNVFPTTYTTKYRLNMAAFTGIPAGVYDLNNAQIRSTTKSSPDGIGVSVFGGGTFTIQDAASLEGLSGFGPTIGNAFSWVEFDYVELKDCSFSQSLNAGPGPGWLLFSAFSASTVRTSGNVNFGAGAVEFTSTSLTIDAYDRFTMTAGAVAGGLNSLFINIYSPDTDISFAQGVGSLEINIGNGITFGPPGSPEYTLGETIFFSSGGDIDFSSQIEQELFAGGTNPPGSPPQTPPFTTPFRGYTAPKDGYLRGVSIILPTDTSPEALNFDITVYVAGAPVLVETFNTLGGALQFSDLTFGRYFTGDLVEVTITPVDVSGAGQTLANGIVVALHSA